MIGFKSFVNPTEIVFDGNITGVVGPNGSGKSNIVDAIRWVLGEQSIKSLRGEGSMSDVIFSGSKSRSAASFASVLLTFDNTDRYFNYDYDEVAITRKLYRSGESEYLINNSTSRLKDIVDILHDVGIGRGDGYSIIGQGQIDQILSSKPEDRRNLFDEAAGIVKFKSRKETAIKKGKSWTPAGRMW